MVVPAIARGVKVDLGQLLLNAKNNNNDKKKPSISIHVYSHKKSLAVETIHA